ncbi:hypothetical protein MMIC_P1803 [Mariprofundus micogutta]|uniref:DNA primase/polymerase bifunctional N-terminal domain-containing protein n=1 Tax=Mariprofundus micogutta TaxID=1921010 RepID=A0A1L8CPJ5_9PROT|nr:bifunctional DNA primase/polymerase [Mariprofundus micogutta]GAV20828.1 hypothetical protein MMIC_P1803 [Mariprofundus micogutta]
MMYPWRTSAEVAPKVPDKAEWHIFPLTAGTKIPIKDVSFKDALPQSEAVKRWPTILNGNYGVVVGKSGYIVIDIDVKDGKVGRETFAKLQEKYGRPDDTYMVTTPSGGFHAYFKRPAGCDFIGNIDIGKDIDIRCDAGYVLPAGAKADGGEYKVMRGDESGIIELPETWQKFIKGIIEQKSKPAAHVSQPVSSGPIPDNQVTDIRNALAYISPDDYDTWLQIGMALKSTGAGEQAYTLWAEWSARSPKFDAEAQVKKWASITPEGGINVESIFAMATDRGWVNIPTPSNEPFDLSGLIAASNDDGVTPERWDAKKEDEIERIPDRLQTTPCDFVNETANYLNGMSRKAVRAAAVSTAVSVACAITSRRFYSENKNVTSIYQKLIMPSGAGKNFTKKGVSSLLADAGLDQMYGATDYSSDSAIRSELLGYPRQFSVIDEFGDKMGNAFRAKGDSQKKSAFMLFKEAYSDADSRTMPKAMSQLGIEKCKRQSSSDNTVHWPALNLLCLTTPGQYLDAMEGSHIEGGFLNRFIGIVLHSEPVIKNRTPSDEVPQSLIDKIIEVNAVYSPDAELTLDSALMKPVPNIVAFSQEAKDLFDAFDDEIDTWEHDEWKSNFSRRWLENAMRISTGFAACNNPHAPVVTRRIAEWCIDYVRFHGERFMRFVKEGMYESPYDKRYAKALKTLRENGRVNLTRLAGLAGFRGLNQRERAALITDMEERGDAAKEVEATKGRAKTYVYPTKTPKWS